MSVQHVEPTTDMPGIRSIGIARAPALAFHLDNCGLSSVSEEAMRTTLNIDDEALASAMQVAPGKTKTDVINEALRE
jgi:hypothetical protein